MSEAHGAQHVKLIFKLACGLTSTVFKIIINFRKCIIILKNVNQMRLNHFGPSIILMVL